MVKRFLFGCVLVCCLTVLSKAWGQQNPAMEIKPIPIEPVTDEFKQAIKAFQEHIKAMNEIAIRFNVGTLEEEAMWKEKWYEMQSQGVPLYQNLISAGVKEFSEDPQERLNVGRWLFRNLAQNVEADRYEGMLEVVQAILASEPQDMTDLHRLMGMTAMAMNEFELARPSLDAIAGANSESPQFLALGSALDRLEADWKQELKYREEDAAGEPLPIVLIKTTKGDIEVELFENNAPETVGNFISLVEAGVYNHQPFHTGKKHFLIQGGGADMDRPPYTIKSEAEAPNSRRFFRGTLGMALSGHPDSAYSQFFIAYLPNAELHPTYTAFGRVTKGMSVVANLNKIDPENKEKSEGEPDEIRSIEIIRKRDHVYAPNKVQ